MNHEYLAVEQSYFSSKMPFVCGAQNFHHGRLDDGHYKGYRCCRRASMKCCCDNLCYLPGIH